MLCSTLIISLYMMLPLAQAILILIFFIETQIFVVPSIYS